MTLQYHNVFHNWPTNEKKDSLELDENITGYYERCNNTPIIFSNLFEKMYFYLASCSESAFANANSSCPARASLSKDKYIHAHKCYKINLFHLNRVLMNKCSTL